MLDHQFAEHSSFSIDTGRTGGFILGRAGGMRAVHSHRIPFIFQNDLLVSYLFLSQDGQIFAS